MNLRFSSLGLMLLGMVVSLANGADWGLKPGTLELKSIGPLAFGPDGVLFVSDPHEALIYAIDTGSGAAAAKIAKLEQKDLQVKLQELLGAPTEVIDLAINPLNGEAILAVQAKAPALVRVDSAGKVSQLELQNIPSSLVSLPNPPANQETKRGNLRNDTVTDIAFINGKLLVAGMSSGEGASTVREVAFPFDGADEGTNIEIFHAAHGKVENYSAVRTFVPITIQGEPSVLAGFTCTPLVQFPIRALEKGAKVRGKTVAELGNRNKPLDIIVYEQNGKTFLLMANTARGVMKISTEDLAENEGLTQPVSGGGTAGQPFEKIESLTGVVQLDKLDEQQAVVLVQRENGLDLLTIALP